MGEIPHAAPLRKMQGFPDAGTPVRHVDPSLDSNRRL
jgi:hypothetical protein